ncbi:DUF2231 domain-containing protein [Cohnella sp. GCM10012308]|uniref:DUF2231 domain-containing protein n=1 Tax=Cohnella sp. GCM10012308 TaxID=3317329 RepID=UPI00360A1CE1
MDYLWNNKHFILTHFPIVLLIFGFLFDLAGLIWKKREWNNAGLVCLIAGTLGAIASVLTGPESPNPSVGEHEMYGKLTMFLAIAISVVRLSLLWAKKKDYGSHPIFLVAALAAAVLVGYTGHLGGEMVHRAPGDFPGGGFGGPGMQQGGQMGQGGQGGQMGQGGQGGQGGDNGGQAPGASSAAANP